MCVYLCVFSLQTKKREERAYRSAQTRAKASKAIGRHSNTVKVYISCFDSVIIIIIIIMMIIIMCLFVF